MQKTSLGSSQEWPDQLSQSVEKVESSSHGKKKAQIDLALTQDQL